MNFVSLSTLHSHLTATVDAWTQLPYQYSHHHLEQMSFFPGIPSHFPWQADHLVSISVNHFVMLSIYCLKDVMSSPPLTFIPSITFIFSCAMLRIIRLWCNIQPLPSILSPHLFLCHRYCLVSHAQSAFCSPDYLFYHPDSYVIEVLVYPMKSFIFIVDCQQL